MQVFSDVPPRVLDLEARQDEALRQLADLEQRVEQVLAEQTAALAKYENRPAFPTSDAA
jgi:hypothetical protein